MLASDVPHIKAAGREGRVALHAPMQMLSIDDRTMWFALACSSQNTEIQQHCEAHVCQLACCCDALYCKADAMHDPVPLPADSGRESKTKEN